MGGRIIDLFRSYIEESVDCAKVYAQTVLAQTVQLTVNDLVATCEGQPRKKRKNFSVLALILNVKVMAKKKPDGKFVLTNTKAGSTSTIQNDGKGRMILMRLFISLN